MRQHLLLLFAKEENFKNPPNLNLKSANFTNSSHRKKSYSGPFYSMAPVFAKETIFELNDKSEKVSLRQLVARQYGQNRLPL